MGSNNFVTQKGKGISHIFSVESYLERLPGNSGVGSAAAPSPLPLTGNLRSWRLSTPRPGWRPTAALLSDLCPCPNPPTGTVRA